MNNSVQQKQIIYNYLLSKVGLKNKCEASNCAQLLFEYMGTLLDMIQNPNVVAEEIEQDCFCTIKRRYLRMIQYHFHHLSYISRPFEVQFGEITIND